MLNMVKETGGKNYPYNENLVGVDESIGSTGNVDDISILSEIRRTNLNNVVIGFLNINSYRNKYEALKVVIQGKIDVMVLVETKLDSSFPTTQFLIEGYAIPFRRDRCNSGGNGGGILIYVREDIPCRLLDKHIFPDDIEGIFIELNFRKSKMLLLGTYHPPNQVDNYYFKAIGNALDIYNNIFDKCILVGDFNAEEIEVDLSNFLEIYGLKNLVHEKTCFKSLTNPTCIDLLLTNCSKSFQNTTVVSSGISDFHKMVVTVMKTTFPKVKPKQIFYRDYKRFNDSMFKDDLKMHLNANIKHIYTNFGAFQELFLRILDKHAPFKMKYVRANEVPYMTKMLRKAIMTRSRLEHKYQKTKSSLDKERFNKHKNFCNRLYKRERKNYYESLNLSHITDNKKFWKIMKPFLTDKGVSQRKITLIETNEIISEDADVAETLNSFFENAVSCLGIKEPVEHLVDTTDVSDSLNAILGKYSRHPSILMIQQLVVNIPFSFCEVNLVDIEREINMLDVKRSNPGKTITAKNFKDYIDICGTVLCDIINHGINNAQFDDAMKLADITPIHKANATTNKCNYRPISGLPSGSKIFERIIQCQIRKYVDTFLSPYLCGYRKGYSVQHALIMLLERWRISLDKNGFGGAILMDLSKAFDTLNHDLLIAKLHAYGFSKEALKLIKSYLTNRWQRTKINNSYSSWAELLQGVPQGSILGPLLFNIYVNDLFYIPFEANLCNFADDNTIYACDISLNNLVEKLESSAALVIDWFRNNYMKLNDSKSHLLVCGNKIEVILAKVGNALVVESHEVKLLGVVIDRDLKFKSHIKFICKKAGKKLNALSRLCNLLSFDKRRNLVKAFVMSQFSFSPLVSMFQDRNLNSKIDALHYRALKIVYRDNELSFKEMLKKDNSVTIHHKNIHFLAIEMYKVKQGIAPPFMSDIFKLREIPINSVIGGLRYQSEFYNYDNPRSIYNGIQTLRSFGPKIWNILPDNIKNSSNISSFKRQIKTWIPLNCPCKLCMRFLPGIGFI